MARRIFSVVFLVTGILVGLGALGHGLAGVKTVDAGFAKVTLEPRVAGLIYTVWYFVSGCMLAFGAIIIHSWWRIRGGARDVFFAPLTIDVLYVVSGVGAVFSHGDPFFWVFTALGTMLIVSLLVLRQT